MSWGGSWSFTGGSDRSQGRLIAIVKDHFTSRVLLPFYELFSLLLPLPIINTAQPTVACRHAYFTWTRPQFWQFWAQQNARKRCVDTLEMCSSVFSTRCHFISHRYQMETLSWLFSLTFRRPIKTSEFRLITLTNTLMECLVFGQQKVLYFAIAMNLLWVHLFMYLCEFYQRNKDIWICIRIVLICSARGRRGRSA